MSRSLIERLAAVPSVGTDYRPYAVAPDGRTVAVQWYREGDWQIFLTSLDGDEPRRVGDLDDPCWCPLFSPDGGTLYFARDDRGSECFDFFRYDPATGALENLLPDTPDFAPLPDFDLSPDGTRIAMTASHGPGYSVAVMPAGPTPRGEGLKLCPWSRTSATPRAFSVTPNCNTWRNCGRAVRAAFSNAVTGPGRSRRFARPSPGLGSSLRAIIAKLRNCFPAAGSMLAVMKRGTFAVARFAAGLPGANRGRRSCLPGTC